MNTRIVENFLFGISPLFIFVFIIDFLFSPNPQRYETKVEAISGLIGVILFGSSPIWIALFLRKRRIKKTKLDIP